VQCSGIVDWNCFINRCQSGTIIVPVCLVTNSRAYVDARLLKCKMWILLFVHTNNDENFLDKSFLTKFSWQNFLDEILVTKFSWQNFLDKIFLTKFSWQNFLDEIFLTKFSWQNFLGELFLTKFSKNSFWINMNIYGKYTFANLGSIIIICMCQTAYAIVRSRKVKKEILSNNRNFWLKIILLEL